MGLPRICAGKFRLCRWLSGWNLVGMQTKAQLTVLYDGGCSLCRASVARVQEFDEQRRIAFLDVHDPAVKARYREIDPEIAMRWMQAVDTRGHVSSGVDAWARMGLLLPGWKLVAWVLLLPGVHWIAAKVYGWVARNRYRWNRDLCADGTCSIHLPPDSSPK